MLLRGADLRSERMTMMTERTTQSTEPDDKPEKAPAAPRCCRRLIRWIEHLLAGAAALLILFMVSPLPQWLHDGLDRQGELRPAKYIICLGGDPSRVIESVLLLNEGYGQRLILSNNEGGAEKMRHLALEWGAPADKVLLDSSSRRTADHPGSVQRQCGVDPANDDCIIVTSYIHLARSKACFEKFGYRRLTMREPRWERSFRPTGGWRNHFNYTPQLIYEYAAMLEYWLRGWI